MKEYCIYNVWNGGTPFITHDKTKSFSQIMNILENIIVWDESVNTKYYVENDFFDNKYPNIVKCKHYKILVREVSSWKEYTDDNLTTKNKNNVFYF